jgi:hypothetical protein
VWAKAICTGRASAIAQPADERGRYAALTLVGNAINAAYLEDFVR